MFAEQLLCKAAAVKMSEAATTTPAEMEQLKQQAEAQMRRSAPPLSGKHAKRRKTGQEGDERHADDTVVGRFSYAADTAIAAGSNCLMASCGFNRQRSAAKELLSIVKPLLPEGTQLQMVKVGCRGLAVVRVEAAPGAGDSPPVNMTALVGQVLDQIQTGRLKHTKFCERIVPAETTCLLTAAAVEGALTRVVSSYVSSLQRDRSSTDAGGDGASAGQQQPLEFAVMYKSRGVDKQVLAEMEQEAAKQQQVQAGQQQQNEEANKLDDKQQDPAKGGTSEQGQQPQQPATASGAAGAGSSSIKGLDRQRIIDMAAAVMERCCKDTGGAKVNLRHPQVVVMVEAVPLLKQQMVCAVAMLPNSMISSAHKLKIKATSANEEASKQQDGKQ